MVQCLHFYLVDFLQRWVFHWIFVYSLDLCVNILLGFWGLDSYVIFICYILVELQNKPLDSVFPCPVPGINIFPFVQTDPTFRLHHPAGITKGYTSVRQ